MRKCSRTNSRAVAPPRPAGGAADDRPLLPERLGNDEAEAFADGLLDDDLGRALERVDLQVADTVEVRQDVDIEVLSRAAHGLLVPGPAFGVVVRHGCDEQELQLR